MDSARLTESEAEVLRVVWAHRAMSGMMPLRREIADQTGKSVQHADTWLKRLEAKGFVTLRRYERRGITLTPKGDKRGEALRDRWLQARGVGRAS